MSQSQQLSDSQILEQFDELHPDVEHSTLAREHGGVFVLSTYDSRSWSVVDIFRDDVDDIDFEEL